MSYIIIPIWTSEHFIVSGYFLKESGKPRPTQGNRTSVSMSYGKTYLQMLESLSSPVVKDWGSDVFLLRTESEPVERCFGDRLWLPKKEQIFLETRLPIAVTLGRVSLVPAPEMADSLSASPRAHLQTSGFIGNLDQRPLSFPPKGRSHDFLIPSWSLEFQYILKTGYPCFIDEEMAKVWVTNRIRGR